MLDLSAWRELWTPESWRTALAPAIYEPEFQQLREAVRTGKPLGSSDFKNDFESQTAQKVSARSVSRPRHIGLSAASA